MKDSSSSHVAATASAAFKGQFHRLKGDALSTEIPPPQCLLIRLGEKLSDKHISNLPGPCSEMEQSGLKRDLDFCCAQGEKKLI